MALLVAGARGPEVGNLQRALNYHLPKELPLLNVDQIFGPKTKARVSRFQTIHGLKIDGIVGPETHQALYTFVDVPHHLIVVHSSQSQRNQQRLNFNDGLLPLPLPPNLPLLPPLQFPFPRPFLVPPPVVPRLQLNLSGLARLFFNRNLKFEVEAGGQTTVSTTIGPGDPEPTRQLHLFNDVKATVWSAPIKRNLTLTGGVGIIRELRLKPRDDKTETTAYVFAKAEIRDVLKIGPLDLAKIEAEAQVKPNADGPPSMAASVTVGPEVEVVEGATIRLAGFSEVQTDGRTYSISSGVKLSGTIEFDLSNLGRK